MLSRIHSFFLGIWERNQRFKPALIATWGIALAWFFVLVSGNLSWLLQKNNFSSALLARVSSPLFPCPGACTTNGTAGWNCVGMQPASCFFCFCGVFWSDFPVPAFPSMCCWCWSA